MTNNKIDSFNELNNKENFKEITEIKLKNEDFAGQLVIEDYPNLERLYLRGIESIEKITLRNLEKLEKCTIFDCNVQELVIEKCPQIEELNVPYNSLTNLEFLKNLEKLQKLDIDDNTVIESNPKYLPKSLKKFSCKNTNLSFPKELQQPSKVFDKNKKNHYGIIVTKKDENGNLTKKFFKLEEKYENERELHNDTYPLMWRTLVKGGVDKLAISEDRMERILKDRITSDLTALNFLGFKKDKVESFASGLAKTSQALNATKWLAKNSFLILTDLLSRWGSYQLGHADTPPAFNIRTALGYSLIYESKIVDKWKEEFEKACYELEGKSAELSIVELPEYTYKQKKDITQEIIKKRFKKHRKENKERDYNLLKITGKASKILAKESEETKFLETIDRDLEELIWETWEKKGTRKLRSELSNRFSEWLKEQNSADKNNKELERLKKEASHFQKQIERLEKELGKIEKTDTKTKKDHFNSRLKEIKVELKDRQRKVKQLEEKNKQQLKEKSELVAQIEVNK